MRDCPGVGMPSHLDQVGVAEDAHQGKVIAMAMVAGSLAACLWYKGLLKWEKSPSMRSNRASTRSLNCSSLVMTSSSLLVEVPIFPE